VSSLLSSLLPHLSSARWPTPADVFFLGLSPDALATQAVFPYFPGKGVSQPVVVPSSSSKAVVVPSTTSKLVAVPYVHDLPYPSFAGILSHILLFPRFTALPPRFPLLLPSLQLLPPSFPSPSSPLLLLRPRASRRALSKSSPELLEVFPLRPSRVSPVTLFHSFHLCSA
jgi:hypothetical protein